MHKVLMRRAINTTRSKARCLASPTPRRLLPQVLYRAGLSSKEGLQEHDSVDPILVVKFPRMLRGPPSALPPGRYLRSAWILREGQWHEMEDKAQIPTLRLSLIATWSVLCFSSILFVVSCARPRCRRSICFLCLPAHLLVSALCAPCLPNGGRWLPRWRAPSMGGTRAFTLPLRFNGRPYSQRIPYLGNTRWTTITEDVWEHMAKKRREMQGHGEPIVPHLESS